MKRREGEEAVTEIVLRILDLYGVLYAHGAQITKPFGQSSARWQIMGVIADEKLTVSQIARQIGNSRQAVQRIANEMNDAGLVTFAENPDHLRSPIVSLTTTGRLTYDQINAIQ